MRQFWLGTHEPTWLFGGDGIGQAAEHDGLALFISRSRLRRLADPIDWAKRLWWDGMLDGAPRVPWALDSGGFTELRDRGQWTVDALGYVIEVINYQHIGALQWAAPRDWMCEPWVIAGGVHEGQRFAGTGLSVIEHQRRTVADYLVLTALWAEMVPARCPSPFRPVVQGYQLADYLRCVQMYGDAGVDLRELPLVGVGSVCRREATDEIRDICAALSGLGLRLHGFGVKQAGLRLYGRYLESADSLAWSYGARRTRPMPGCEHANCASCPRYALAWRERLLAGLADEADRGEQLALWDAA